MLKRGGRAPCASGRSAQCPVRHKHDTEYIHTPVSCDGALKIPAVVLLGRCAGWQLLAHQVTASAGEQGSGSYARDDATAESDQRAGNKPGRLRGAGGGSRNQRLAAHNGDSSCMSDDDDDDASVVGAAAAAVAPRPHQWLYKEYKIQDEIGSGGFGRVCR